MRAFMLTEDIDSSMRVVAGGRQIVSDPRLHSTELAPGSWSALWGQRLRWAQGWSQVSLRYLFDALRKPPAERAAAAGARLPARLAGGVSVDLPAGLSRPDLLFLRGEPPVSWFVPVFVATTLFTLSAGLVQAWTAWRRSARDLRRHGRWFLLFGLLSQLFYTELKNVITRTAHLKEGMRERKWKVTPRATALGPRALR